MNIGSPEHLKLEGVGGSKLPVLMLSLVMLYYSIGFISKPQCLLVLPAPFVAAVSTGTQIASGAEATCDLLGQCPKLGPAK